MLFQKQTTGNIQMMQTNSYSDRKLLAALLVIVSK